MVKLLATGDALAMLMASGFGEHVTPGGEFAAGQVTLTIPVNPPLGVTVIADIPLPPAVTVTAAPLTVNEPVVAEVTTTVAFPAPDEDEFA